MKRVGTEADNGGEMSHDFDAFMREAMRPRRPGPLPEWDGKTTYWNGEPTPCREVRVVVGPSPVATWWCAGLAGQEREAVEVRYYDQPPFYLDNEDGQGWAKVTRGFGSPQYGHAELPVERVVE